MTLQERQLLQDFLKQLTQVRGIPKDPEAQAMIQTALAQQPDAPYLLVQRAILLEQALSEAKAQMAQLQGQSGNFLGGGSAWNQAPLEPSRSAPLPANTPPAPQPRARDSCLAERAAFWAAQPQRRPVWPGAPFYSRDWKICLASTVAVSLARARPARW